MAKEHSLKPGDIITIFGGRSRYQVESVGILNNLISIVNVNSHRKLHKINGKLCQLVIAAEDTE